MYRKINKQFFEVGGHPRRNLIKKVWNTEPLRQRLYVSVNMHNTWSTITQLDPFGDVLPVRGTAISPPPSRHPAPRSRVSNKETGTGELKGWSHRIIQIENGILPLNTI